MSNRKQSIHGKSKLAAAVVAFAATCLGAPVNAATSFPDYPLQTGTSSIPPNIMFILDDSGSMTWQRMPTNGNGLGNDWEYRTYVFNTIYYDPRVDYKPWMRADRTRMTGGTSYSSVYADFSAAGGGTIDLKDDSSCEWSVQNGSWVNVCGGDQTFYVPKNMNSTDSGYLASRNNYYRYQIQASGNVRRCERNGNNWGNCSNATPTGRSAEAERTNYATWFSYYRTRMKAAKAGASEAFGELGENFRVGYDSIWNRNGSSDVAGNRPAFWIPVGESEGLFNGANKKKWFGYLHGAVGSGNTPLHGALQRVGDYYEEETGSAGPWGPEQGEAQLSCRQNYAILTTDGYWNNFSDFTDVGNADGVLGDEITSADGVTKYQYSPKGPYKDGRDDTLADVAMHYWKRDLRDDLANNVPSSSQNEAFWQHMVTFGISIGLEGNMGLRSVDEVPTDVNWTNPNNTEDADRIDDLLHAAVNGRGQFVAASDPKAFAKALKDSLAAIQRRKASGSNVASNGPSLTDGSRLFQATYTSGEWSGDVASLSVGTGSINSVPVWSTSAWVGENKSAYLAREVFTWDAKGRTFPTTGQKGELARTDGTAPVTGADNAAYIKGTQTREGTDVGDLRVRTTPIGDIVNSSPFYVKESDSLFVGANDGMLHAIDGDDGAVLFSYVPAGLDFKALATLSDPDYQHKFFVDGGIDVTTKQQGKGSNILVGALGRGGRGVFALDVTDPAGFGSGDVLWDKTFTSDAADVADGDMGYVIGSPLVRMGNNDQTLAFVGNGIDSKNGSATLFIYNAVNGSLVKKFVVDATGGGLAEPRAADIDNDGKADFIYAGDMKGNVWKFDIQGSTASEWNVAYKSGSTPQPMFTARDEGGDAQPITSAVALAREPATGRIFVLFGTGKYVTNGDLSSNSTQTIYALVDDGQRVTSRNDLQEREIPHTGLDSKGRKARAWESYSPLDEDARGWFVDLGIPTAGERVVTAPFVRGRALWFSSIIPQPGSGCDSGGTGYLNAVDAFTGTNPKSATGTETYIDVDNNDQGDDKLAGSDEEGEEGFITSVDLGVGMPSQGSGLEALSGGIVCVFGSDAKGDCLDAPPPADGAKRLNWRELYDRN